MPSTWQRPKARTYTYNYKIQNDYYKPTLDTLDKIKKDSTPKSYAERIKKYPVYGGQYPEAPEEEQQRVTEVSGREEPKKREFYKTRSTAGIRESPERSTTRKDTSARLAVEKAKLQELEERQFPSRKPIWQVHPFYLPEDTKRVPPREDSVWPESRPHFHLVSSYDLMVGYLGLKDMAARENEKLQRAREQMQ